MAQDIRELLKRDKQIPVERIKNGHEQRFLSRLENELPVKKKRFNYNWLKVAASIVVVLSVSIFSYNRFDSNAQPGIDVVEGNNAGAKNATLKLNKQTSTLAEISPEYEEVENTILTSIKFQLSNITIDDSNRELVESFKVRLGNLDLEYQRLNKELENLKIRLSLLSRLKDKLKELERIEKENYNEIQA